MKWFTADLHFAHPFVAALRGYALPRMNNTLLLHGHTHAHDPLEFGRHHNEINVGLDAWCFEPVNEAELVDNWLQTASSAV